MPFLNPKLGIDFTDYIADRTLNFTGREWVFEAIQNWLADPKGDRFFLLTGEPGSGKTAIAARLAQFAQGTENCSETKDYPEIDAGFLHAVFFCSARESTWTSPLEFSRTLAMQLAQSIPEFALALKDIGEKTVNINASITVGSAESSTMQAVVVQNLSIQGLSGQDAFDQIVVNPLRQIRGEGFSQPVSILVDSLDEALTHDKDIQNTIVNLLSKLSKDAGVRFILTSRNEGKVKDKFIDIAYEELFLSSPENLERNEQDIQEYIDEQFRREEKLLNSLQIESLDQKTSTTKLIEKSEGNFLYVRFLLESVALGQQGFANLDGLPQGLDELYYISLGRVVELGKKDWSEVYAPVMGVLLAAQESLTESQIRAFTKLKESVVWNCLNDLQQFLDEIESEDEETLYKLYHQSVTDFLGKRQLVIRKKKLNSRYYLSGQEQHQRLLEYYYPDDKAWSEVKLEKVDPYGLRNLAKHLMEAGYVDKLHQLINKEWMQARYQGSAYTYDGFLADVDIAWRMALTDERGNLPILIRFQTVRQVVNYQVSLYNNADLRTLVWLKRTDEALSHARLRSDVKERFHGLLAICNTLQEKGQTDSKLLDEIWGLGRSIKNDWAQTIAFAELGKALSQAARKTDAKTVFAEAREIAWSIREQDMGESGIRERALRYLAGKLIEAGFFIDVVEVLQTISLEHQFGEWGGGPEPRAWMQEQQQTRHLSSLIEKHCFSEAQDFVKTFRTVWQRGNGLIQIAVALSSLDKGEEADSLLTEVESLANDESLITRIIILEKLATALAKSGREKKLAEITQEIELKQVDFLKELAVELSRATSSLGISAKALSTDIVEAFTFSLSQSQNFTAAKEVAISHQSSVVRTKMLSHLAITLFQSNREAEADETLKEAEKNLPEIQTRSAPEQVEALSQLAIGLAQTGQQEKARATLKEAEKASQNIASDSVWDQASALRLLAVAFTEAGFNPEAEAICKQAREAAQRAENDGYQPSSLLYPLAEELAQVGQFAEAEKAALTIQNYSGQASALKQVAESLAKVGKLSEANIIFRQAEEIAQLVVNSWQQAQALRALTATAARMGHFAEAEQISQLITDESEQGYALEELALAFAKARQPTEAKKISQLIKKEWWGYGDTMDKLTEAFAQTGEFELAEQVAHEIQDPAKKAITIKKIAVILIEAKHFQEARRLIEEIEEQPILQAYALNQLVVALRKDENNAEANTVYLKFKSIVANIKEVSYDSRELFKLFVLEMLQAEHFSEIIEMASSLDSYYQQEILSQLITVFVQADRIEEARKVLMTVPADEQTQQALVKALAKALTQAGYFNKAIEVSNSLNDWEKSELLKIKAESLARSGQFEESLKLLESLNEYQRREPLKTLAKLMAQAGQIIKAVEILESAEEYFANKIFCEFAVILDKIGQNIESSKLFEKVKNFSKDSLNNSVDVVKALLEVKREAEAEEFLSQVDIKSVITGGNQWEQLKELAAIMTQARNKTVVEKLLIEARMALSLIPEDRQMSGSDFDSRTYGRRELAEAFINIHCFAEALVTLGTLELNKFLQYLAELILIYEKVERKSSSIQLIQEALSIAGWIRSDWREICTLLSAQTESVIT